MDALTPATLVQQLAAEIAAGRLIPYLGPEVLNLGDVPSPVPTGARELSHHLSSRVAVPGRIRNNLWHTGQYIESFKHRVTLDKLMAETFKVVPEPTPLHRWLAKQVELPLIIDTWYDGSMAAALTEAGRGDWGTVQGASKARRTTDVPWTRLFDHNAKEVGQDAAAGWQTVLYKPHGAAQPEGDVLASDSDYVEVLTEIDIQNPIPDAIKNIRTGRSFLFLGCRFYDQILRTFARCIIRRSQEPHYAVIDGELTKNELKFLEVEGITPIQMPLAEAAKLLIGAKLPA